MNQSYSSGALTTNGSVKTQQGILTYAEAGAGAVSLYDGTSTGGVLLSTIPSSSYRSFNTPLKFKEALFITVASGTAVVHTG